MASATGADPVTKGDSWSIGTYVRLKPPLGLKKKNLIGVAKREVQLENAESRSILEIDIPEDADPGLLHSNESGKIQFEYDQIFDSNVEQDELFHAIAKDKVLGALDGINSTIFAYGQTGSGKTYTIFGGDSYQERGIIPRTINLLFEEFAKRSQAANASEIFRFEMSFTEVYKESVYDLLDPNKRGTSIEQWTPVQIMESENGLVLRNINVFEVTSEEDALKLFFLGNSNRMTVATAMNAVSSRSHAVFTIVVKSECIRNGKKVYTSGKINLVDLAGSERMYKTTNSKGALTEAKSINLSLHYLEQVIVYLREQAQNPLQNHIPYRNSVLTNMLRDSLGGNCKSCFILTLALDRDHFSESISTCRFGQRCGEIKVQIHANTEVGLSDQIKELAARVKTLEKQLAETEAVRAQLQETLNTEREEIRLATTPRTLSVDEKAECKACVQALFASAKEIVALKADETTTEVDVQAATNAILQSSQEKLYASVQGMNKNILVELSIALGGLVQSMYIEREKAKVEEANRAARKALKAEKATRSKSDDAVPEEIKKKGVSLVDGAMNGAVGGVNVGLQAPMVMNQNNSSAYPMMMTGVATAAAPSSAAGGAVVGGRSSSLPPNLPSAPLQSQLHHQQHQQQQQHSPAAPPAVASMTLNNFVANPTTNNPAAANNSSSGLNTVNAVAASIQAPSSRVAATNNQPVALNTNGGAGTNNNNSSSHSNNNGSTSNVGQNSTALTVIDGSVALGQQQQRTPRPLTDEQRQLLLTGAQFTKMSRGLFAAKQSRWVTISPDMLYIVWRAVQKGGDSTEARKSPTVNPLRLFSSVELDTSEKEGCGVILRGSANTIHLIMSSEATKEQNVELATRWVEALRLCAENAALVSQ